MNKIAIYALLAAGIAFTSCDEVEDMTGKPQVNPEIPGYDISKLQVSSPIGTSVDLPALNASSTKDVAVIGVTDVGNLPEGYHLTATYIVAANEEFSPSYPIEVAFSEDGTTGNVTTGQLESAYEALLGLNTTPADFHGRAELYAKNDKGSVIRLGGSDVYYAQSSFELTPDPVFVLYTPGDSNGWNGAQSMQLPSTDGKNYSGLAYLTGSFKFTSAPGWDGTNYGAGTETGTLSIDGSADNLSVGESGLYWVEVNTPALTYNMTGISSLGVIGNFNGWNGDAEMSHNDDYTIWTADVTFDGTGEWKIRANNDWAISFGTSLENMTYNGSNLPDSGVGTYTVTFDISKVPYTATCTAK